MTFLQFLVVDSNTGDAYEARKNEIGKIVLCGEDISLLARDREDAMNHFFLATQQSKENTTMFTQPNEALLAVLNQLSDNSVSSFCEVCVCRHDLSFEDNWKLGFRLATEAKGRDVVHFDGHVLGTVFFFYGPQEDLVVRAKEALVKQKEQEEKEDFVDEDDEV